MNFGPYDEQRFCHIEKSKTYEAIQQGVKIAEFLLLYPDEKVPKKILVVEAKSSSPKPKTDVKFKNYIEELKQKFINTLSLCMAMCLKRHNTCAVEFPEAFKRRDLAEIGFCFVLVIK